MKDSNIYSQQATRSKDELCNEKKCATCFENRGCMYEQYFSVPSINLITLFLQNQPTTQSHQTISEGRNRQLPGHNLC